MEDYMLWQEAKCPHESRSMSIQFDPKTGEITYNGKKVGEQTFADGKSRVRLNIELETEGDWIVPLSWFAYGLTLLPENRSPPPSLEVSTPENGIEAEYNVLRFLTEKQVKRDGYIWTFHKTDADHWPSELHGHDYEKGLKLDVLTGGIYDAGTRQLCKKLKLSQLLIVQSALRASTDFSDKINGLIP
jgi:hypothetical protein